MLRLYADECAHGDVIRGVRQCGVDVITAQEERREGAPDPEVLDRATELGRVLFSQDDDLLAEATRRQRGAGLRRQSKAAASICKPLQGLSE